MLVDTIGAFAQGDVLSTTEQLRLMLDVNVAAALWLSQAAARHIHFQAAEHQISRASVGRLAPRWTLTSKDLP